MKIFNNKKYFYQWDMNMKITSDYFNVGDEIHFSSAAFSNAVVVRAYEQDGKIVADVPNVFLQSSGLLAIYKYVFEKDSAYTVSKCVFEVKKRPKPDDYVYTETEVLTWKALDDKLRKLEESITEEYIGKKVEDYIINNKTEDLQGAQGRSAYEVWLYAGNVGTEADFLASLQGERGEEGEDGYSPTVTVSKSGKVTTIQITDTNGIKTVSINDGYTPQKDVDYFDGKDGTSVTVSKVTESTDDGGSSVVTFSDGKTLTVKNGNTGTPGTSVTVTSVSESTESGGENVVTFSDGKTVIVKNGRIGSPGKDGTDGQRGTGAYKVTTAPSSYTTAVGDFTPTYRIAKSTVLAQAQISEVLVGDVLIYSYYTYAVGYIDSSYVYLGARTSIRGAPGAAGEAYTLTDADKESIAQAVTDSLTTESWTFTLKDGTTVTKAVLLG